MSEHSNPKTDFDPAGVTSPTLAPSLSPSSHQESGPPTTLVSQDESSGSDCSVPVGTPAGQPLPYAAGRNLLFEEIARGGMGAVLKGRDPDLNREVAVKVLLDSHRDKPEFVRRFLEEAQIGGQLQHPGTVPVYELGRFADGRPFFTMKLVKGHTLAKLLADRTSPQQDLQRFLTIFEQACQAIAYAHARGVIHRDLKPANVMVGAFGEVQVMDWGMSKVLGQPTAPVAAASPPAAEGDETLIHTVRSDSAGDESRSGTVMGTPAFIPPEQAKGEVGSLDERADVFGLGAILCTILTGQPPYTGGRALHLMEKAWRGDLADAWARLDDCGADAELVRLCKGCLAADREGRPRDAGVLARRLAAYQAGVRERLRHAELESAAAQARAGEERKRRKLTAALGMALLGLLVGVGGGILWLQRQEAMARQRVESALERVAELQRQGRWAEAGEVLGRASELVGSSGPEDLRQRVAQIQGDLDLVSRLDAIRLKRATFYDGKFDDLSAARDYAAAFQEARLMRDGDDPEEVAARVRDSAVRAQLVAALDDWAGAIKEKGPSERLPWLLAVSRRADPDDWRDRFRDPTAWDDRQALGRLAEELLRDEAKLRAQSPKLLEALGKSLRRTRADPLPVLKSAWRRHPTDFWLNLQLGNALLAVAKGPERKAKGAEAAGYYRAALALRPEAPVVYNNLANALKEQGLLDEAIAAYHQALELDRGFALAHYNLGNALCDKARHEEEHGRPEGARAREEAIREYRSAIDLNPELSTAHTNLANILRDRGRHEEAIAAYRQAIDAAPRQALAYNGLGNALRDAGRPREAIQAYCVADHFSRDRKDALYLTNLGETLYEMGRWEQSVAAFHLALARDDKHVPAHAYLGRTLLALERFAAAGDATRLALQYLPSNAPQRDGVSKQLERSEQLLAIKDRLPSLLSREALPKDNPERLLLASFCQEDKRLYAVSADFYEDAFKADPKLGDDLGRGYRYAAACAAAMAARGRGIGVATLDDGQRACLRKRALEWLRADLALCAKEAASPDPKSRATVRERLAHWLTEDDLAGLRQLAALRDHSEDERDACLQLWNDVKVLLRKLGGKGTK
jgi:serine/threonine-protein kinase